MPNDPVWFCRAITPVFASRVWLVSDPGLQRLICLLSFFLVCALLLCQPSCTLSTWKNTGSTQSLIIPLQRLTSHLLSPTVPLQFCFVLWLLSLKPLKLLPSLPPPQLVLNTTELFDQHGPSRYRTAQTEFVDSRCFSGPKQIHPEKVYRGTPATSQQCDAAQRMNGQHGGTADLLYRCAASTAPDLLHQPVSVFQNPPENVNLSSAPSEYHDLNQVFSKNRALSLPLHRPYDCAILHPGAPLERKCLISQSPEKEAMENYIQDSVCRTYPPIFLTSRVRKESLDTPGLQRVKWHLS